MVMCVFIGSSNEQCNRNNDDGADDYRGSCSVTLFSFSLLVALLSERSFDLKWDGKQPERNGVRTKSTFEEFLRKKLRRSF